MVQGPVFSRDPKTSTAVAIKSIKQHFKGSRVIFSTHDGQELDGLEADEVLVSPDPGFRFEDVSGRIKSNLSRQIVSARVGLEAVRTPYAVKTRSDLKFLNANLLRRLQETPGRPPSRWNLGESQLAVSNFTTVHPGYVLPLPHHPCDSLQAGLSEDLLKLWSCPLPPDSFYTFTDSRFANFHGFSSQNRLQFRAEVWIWLNYVSGVLDFMPKHSLDSRPEIIAESLEVFARNLVVLSPRMLGVKHLKNKYSLRTRMKMMSHLDWVKVARASGVTPRILIDPAEVLLAVTKLLISLGNRERTFFGFSGS